MTTYPQMLLGSVVLALALCPNPAHAADECRLTQVTSLAMSYDQAGRPIIPVTLDGYQRYLLVDTGAGHSALDRAPAYALGLQAWHANTVIRNVSGETSDIYVIVNEFFAGAMRAQNLQFMIWPGDQGRDSEIASIGVLGANIFAYYDLDLDFGTNTLNFFQQDHCEGEVVYWLPEAIAIVPFELDQSDHITFPITLDGVVLSAIMDTGAATTTLNKNVAEHDFGLDFSSEDNVQVGTLGEDEEGIYQHRFGTLSFGGVDVVEPTLTVLPDLMSSGVNSFMRLRTSLSLPDIIFGMTVLSQLHVYIAYGEKKLYITEAGGTLSNP